MYTLRLARALAGRGHAVLVLTAVHDLGARPFAVRRLRQDDFEVVELVNVHHRGTLESTYADAALEAAATPVIRDFRPDAVHIQHLLNLSAGLVGVARNTGARVLLTLHDYWLSCPRDGLRMREDLAVCERVDHRTCAACLKGSPYLAPALQRGLASAARGVGLGRHLHRLYDAAPRLTAATLRLLRLLSPGERGLVGDLDRRVAHLRRVLEGVHAFLAPTAFARDRALALGLPPERVRLQPLGAVPGPVRSRRAGARKRFGFIGTLAPHKGAHVLVEAFRGLADPDARLELRGSLSVDPGYAAALTRAIAGDARIRLAGAFPEGDQGRVLEEMDALVLPSVWWENGPLTVLEALAAGLPVVASRVGGVPELVPETAGLLVPPGDVAALRAALADLAAGRRLAERLDPLPLKTVAQGAEELESLYRGL